jgi:hypothetical protein
MLLTILFMRFWTLFVCASGRTNAFFDNASKSLVLFENDKIVAYDVPIFTYVDNNRIEQVDSFLIRGPKSIWITAKMKILYRFFSINENPRIVQSMIFGSNSNPNNSSYVQKIKDVDQSISGKNKEI